MFTRDKLKGMSLYERTRENSSMRSMQSTQLVFPYEYGRNMTEGINKLGFLAIIAVPDTPFPYYFSDIWFGAALEEPLVRRLSDS